MQREGIESCRRTTPSCASRTQNVAAAKHQVGGVLGLANAPVPVGLIEHIGHRAQPVRVALEALVQHSRAEGVGQSLRAFVVYDKFSRVLRVETTVNDVSFFKHHRKVEHRGAAATRELAPLKKSIYSLIASRLDQCPSLGRSSASCRRTD